MTNRRTPRTLGIGELGRRITLAFLTVALMAIIADVIITSVTAASDLDSFVRQQETTITRAAAGGASIAYSRHGGWQAGKLSPVVDVVSRTHAAIRVTDAAGRPVAASPDFFRYPAGPAASAPVVVSGRQVGLVTVRFDHHGIVADADRVSTERWHVRLSAGAISALIALIVSVLVIARITSPLERLLTAMRARGAGDRAYRIKDVRAVGVLGELLAGFNQSADSFDHQEVVRRNLVADVAHELRTPVAILQAGHDAMADGITQPSPENLSSLRDEVLRLGRVLDDLRALAAAESAALQLQLGPADLAEIATGAVSALRDAFEIAGLTLTCESSSTVAMCDRDRMREVITNLLTNSLKYTPSGGTITVEVGGSGDGMALVRITDTGVGIPADELPHVTERFFRGRLSAEMAAGSGLGLSIVAELVHAQHGELDIRSEPDAGTTVTISVPQAPPRLRSRR